MPAREIHLVVPNFKRRLTGVTSTIIQLVPLHSQRLAVAILGPGLPAGFPRLGLWQVPGLLIRPHGRPFRIWHARRNIEMIAGVLLKYVLRAPLRLVFTSAAQRWHKPLTRWLISRMDHVIATSVRSGSYLKVPHTVIGHGVDTDRFTPPARADDRFAAARLPGKYAIGCFGRVRPQKGTDLFIDAMICLLPAHPDWTAIITGRVTPDHMAYFRKLKARIVKAGLDQRIRFLGEVPDAALWHRRMSLYVAPSRKEGFGLTPLEAMASATPVVASDAGAYAEMIVEGETGSLVPAGDGAALEAAIGAWMVSPARCAAAGKAARDHVCAHFPLSGEADAIEAVYRGLWSHGT